MDVMIAEHKPWSYSKLKAFEDCPRRYHETQVLKRWPEAESEQLAWGNEAHAALAATLKKGTPLPTQFALLQKWVDSVIATPGERLVEDQCQWAVDRNFKPTTWFSKTVWLRSIADVFVLDPPVALVVDWKAGASRNVDPIQLTLTSLMAFLHFPKLKAVRGDFVWLKEDCATTQVLYREECADQWAMLLPRVERLQEAHRREHFPPKPGYFCRSWCSVEDCEHHGK